MKLTQPVGYPSTDTFSAVHDTGLGRSKHECHHTFPLWTSKMNSPIIYKEISTPVGKLLSMIIIVMAIRL